MGRKTSLRIIFCGLCGLHDEKHSDSDIIYCLCVTLRDLLCDTVKPKDDPEPLHGSLFESPLIYWLTNCIEFLNLSQLPVLGLFIYKISMFLTEFLSPF